MQVLVCHEQQKIVFGKIHFKDAKEINMKFYVVQVPFLTFTHGSGGTK
jgi:hypothetical protein